MASYLQPKIHASTVQLTDRATGAPPAIPAGQSCCGLASFSSGDTVEAKKLAQRNITAFADSTLPILTSCASCYAHLSSYPELFAGDPDWEEAAVQFANRLREFSSFFLSALDNMGFAGTPESLGILYHDPCHLRFGPKKIMVPPRSLLEAATGFKPLELPHGPQCCGNGGLFSLAHDDLSRQILQPLTNEISELSARQVVTTCSGCLLQLTKGVKTDGMEVRVVHLSLLLKDLLKESAVHRKISKEID
jgi:glycolate oxidase iron-sulfur subunit